MSIVTQIPTYTFRMELILLITIKAHDQETK